MAIRIFIDQGHNPVNPNAGAEGNGLREQDLTFVIGRLTADLLRSDPRFEVRTSRSTADEILGTSNLTSLSARVNAANEWGADWFVSLHTNAYSGSAASGVEAFVYSVGSPGFRMGENIVTQISLETGLTERGTFARPSLYVLRRTAMPAVLVEMGFISNPNDARLMKNEPERFARGVYQGILNYYGLEAAR